MAAPRPATAQEIVRVQRLGDEIVALMRDWSSYAAKVVTPERTKEATDRVQAWLRDARAMNHPGIQSAETVVPVLVPTNEQTASMEKAGREILKQFRLSLAWNAPIIYGTRYFPSEVASMVLHPSRAVGVMRAAVTALVSLGWKVAKAPFSYVLVPTVKVAGGVALDVGRGLAKGGERVIKTLDFFTNNLTFFALAAAALYLAPQILGQVGRARRAYKGE